MEKCTTCHFFDRRQVNGGDGRSVRMGQCRRCAPLLTPNPTKTYMIEGVWPTVRDDDWCGEWKIVPRRASVAMVPPHQVVGLPVPLAMAGD
jgi:hypothetical protein